MEIIGYRTGAMLGAHVWSYLVAHVMVMGYLLWWPDVKGLPRELPVLLLGLVAMAIPVMPAVTIGPFMGWGVFVAIVVGAIVVFTSLIVVVKRHMPWSELKLPRLPKFRYPSGFKEEARRVSD